MCQLPRIDQLADAVRRTDADRSCLRLGLEHLPALVHAGLQINMVRTAQFPRILVLHIGRLLERIGGSAHPAPRGRGFSFGDGHGCTPSWRANECSEGRAYRGSARRTLGGGLLPPKQLTSAPRARIS